MANYFDKFDPSEEEKKKGNFFDQFDTRAVVKEEKPVPFSLADTALSVAEGAVGATKSIAQAFGAENVVAEKLGDVQKSLTGMVSPARTAERERRAQLEKEAAESGDTMKELGAFLGGVKEAPIQSVAQAAGSIVPTALATIGAVVTGAPASIAAAVAIGAKFILGGIQGAGEVKGSIYENVERELIASGVPKEEARTQAIAAQDYLGKNMGNIAIGSGAGVVAGGTGVESVISRQIAGRLGKEAVQKQVTEGLGKRALKGSVGEALPEGVQAGQQQYATNVALTREGIETPAFQGVIGSAARDALTSALLGGGVGALTSRQKTQLEDAKDKAEETNQPQEVILQLPYDPTVTGGTQGTTTIIVNPDGSTSFPSEKNRFAEPGTAELTEAGLREKYTPQRNIQDILSGAREVYASEEDRANVESFRAEEARRSSKAMKKLDDLIAKRKATPTADAQKAATSSFNTVMNNDVLASFGIGPTARLRKDNTLTGLDIRNPEDADKVKTTLELYKAKASQGIKTKIEDYLKRPEFTGIQPEVSDAFPDTGDTVAFIPRGSSEVKTYPGNVIKKGDKYFIEYDRGEGRKGEKAIDTDRILVNPTPDEIELMNLHKQITKLSAEPDVFKKFVMRQGIAPELKQDLGAGDLSVSPYIRRGGQNIDQLASRAIDEGLFTSTGDDVVDSQIMMDMVTDLLQGRFVRTGRNAETYGQLESLYGRIDEIMNQGRILNDEDIASFVAAEERQRADDRLVEEAYYQPDQPSFALEQPTPEQLQAQEDARLVAEKTEAEAKAKADKEAKEAQAKKEITQASEKAAGQFELGKTAEENLSGQKDIFTEAPKKPKTMKQLAKKTPEIEEDLKKLPRDKMSNLEREGMDIADKVESYGEKDFAYGLRGRVRAGYIKTEKDLDFYRKREQEYAARIGKAKEKPSEKITMANFAKGYENDVKRLIEAKGLFATETSDMLDIANSYMQKLTDAINDAGYKVIEVNPTAPTNVRNLHNKLQQIAGSMNRLLKENEALNKGYERANENRYLATIKVLTNDFKDVDTMLGEKENKSASIAEETDSPEFKKWFGKSKVVGKNGKPEVLYHGTVEDVDQFYPNQFFAYSPKAATSYALKEQYEQDTRFDGESEGIKGANILPVYIRAEKTAEYEDVMKAAKKLGLYDDNKEDSFQYTSSYTDKKVADAVIKELKKQGFDSIFHYDYDLDGNRMESLQVFDPKAIKSVFNEGEYSFETGEISKSLSTANEISDANKVAKDVGGDVVYQRGEIALVRGYSVTGQPVYLPVKGVYYGRTDIDSFSGKLLPVKDLQELRAVKKDLEDKDAALHKKSPFITFKNGFAKSESVPNNLAGVLNGWKEMLGLKGVNVYVTTIDDAKANKLNFTGPHRVIGSSTLDANDNGSMRRMRDGSYYIAFNKGMSKLKMLETLAHELGHIHEREAYMGSGTNMRYAIRKEYEKWLDSQKGKTARQLVDSLRARATAKTTTVRAGAMADNLTPYWKSFSEWYADQVSRWATTSEKPVTQVEKFFEKLARVIRNFFNKIQNAGYLPNETFKQYLDDIASKNIIIDSKPTDAAILEKDYPDQGELFSRTKADEIKLSNISDKTYEKLVRDQFTQKKIPFKQRWEELRPNLYDRIIKGLFDEFRFIKKYSPEAYMKARLSKAIDGALEGLLYYGEVKLTDGALDIKPGSKGLVEIYKPLGTEVDNYHIWKALNRDSRMPADRRSFSDELVAGRAKLVEGDIDGKPRIDVYRSVLEQEQKLNRSVLDVAKEQGLLDDEAYKTYYEDIYYIPFYKAMEETGDIMAISAPGKLTGQYFSKKLKGGEKQTNDLMENVLMNWSHILSAAMKNKAGLDTLKAAEQMGAAEKVTSSYEGKDAVKMMEDGKQVYYAVTDPDLLDSISLISYMGPKSAFLDVAKGFTNALRFGVTLSPAYKVRNLIRDSIQSAAVSDIGFNVMNNVRKGLALSDRGNPTFMSALVGGGIFEMGVAHEGDQAKLIKRLIDKGVKPETILDDPTKIKDFLVKGYEWYNEQGNRFENANRLTLYDKLRKEGKSHLEASYAARDLMDFSSQGSFRAIKVVSQLVPFFNARLQGIYKLGRDGVTPTYRVLYNMSTGKEIDATDKKKAMIFSTVTSSVMLASMLLYMQFKDDEDFKRREDWDRDNFWWFKVNGTIFRVPKPFEIGAAGTIAERTLEQIFDESVEGKVFGKRLQSMLTDTFAMNPVPQAFKPLIDLYANRDSFTGAPIESAGMERLSKQERFTDNTSALAKALGGISQAGTRILTFSSDAEGISPVQVDYAIKAYLGWAGSMAASISDKAVQPWSEVEKPSKPVIDTLAMGFVKTVPETQSKWVTQFYDTNKLVNQAFADMKRYAELGESEKVAKIVEEKGDLLRLQKIYDKTSKQLAEYRKYSQTIARDKTMSAEEKELEIRRVRLLISDTTKAVEELRVSLKR